MFNRGCTFNREIATFCDRSVQIQRNKSIFNIKNDKMAEKKALKSMFLLLIRFNFISIHYFSLNGAKKSIIFLTSFKVYV